jgi:CheY-like chemotaxis protein
MERTINPTDILVVDDDPLLRLGMVCMLRELGYAPISAQDGARALPLIEKGTPIDLLITDYNMPGINGVELAQLMARAHPGLQVLIVSGERDIAGQLSPGWRQLAKPFTTCDLQQALLSITSA